jgi:hypothetical protein
LYGDIIDKLASCGAAQRGVVVDAKAISVPNAADEETPVLSVPVGLR